MADGLPTALGEWATEVPWRSPRFKVHSSRGTARAALSYALGRRADAHECAGGRYCGKVRGGTLYERVGAEWVRRLHVGNGSPECSLPWRAEKNEKRALAEAERLAAKRHAEEDAVHLAALGRTLTSRADARRLIDALDAHRKVHGSPS